MLRHSDIWRAIDLLARERGMSASGLARRAGLDPTTFNKSKRVTREGKLRWPSTESIAKVLQATGASLGEFVSYIGEGAGGGVYRNIPVVGFAQAGTEGYFDDAGYPTGAGWDEIPFPEVGDPHAYALEISGDNIRRSDRVVLKTYGGEVMAKLLRRQTAHKYELRSFNPEHEDRMLTVDDVDWIARIIWASQ
jgi:phage repressor protein C with HTH and peptisase S24 domain